MSELHREIGRAAADGVEAAGFFASILAGLLLGLLGDAVFDTDPWLVVIGIISGSVTGFWRMWTIATRETDS